MIYVWLTHPSPAEYGHRWQVVLKRFIRRTVESSKVPVAPLDIDALLAILMVSRNGILPTNAIR